jgi:hypothetical protein
MGAQEDALILEYLNAFQAANVMNAPPQIDYARGWFTFKTPRMPPRKYRRREVEAMRDRLRDRVPRKIVLSFPGDPDLELKSV